MEQTKVTIFQNVHETKTPFYITIKDIFERIRTGKNERLIQQIRSESDAKKRSKLKCNLPSVCFSGIFTERKISCCKQHTGLLAIDFDHLENPFEIKNKLKTDKYVLSCFISPSGDGVKAIVKIPANIETHKKSCFALTKHFKLKELDYFEDISRVCFESYDTDIYVNYYSEVFTQLLEIETKIIEKPIQQISTEVITNHDIIFKNIRIWCEKKDVYSDGNKHKFLVKFAGACNRFGLPEHFTTINLKKTYQYAATYVNDEDFTKIVEKVYKNYSSQFNISQFDINLTAYDKDSGEVINNEILDQYKDKEREEYLLSLLQKSIIDLNNIPPRPVPILSIRNDFDMKCIPIFTSQNISVLEGKAKSKKTFMQSILASALVANGEFSNKIISSLPQNKTGVLIFDTEQGIYDVYRVANRIKYLSGTNADNLAMFSLRGEEPRTMLDLLEFSLKTIENVGIIFIDQVADLMTSINDEKEAVRVVKKLEFLSKHYDIHICCNIHLNKASDFATGWLGSQLIKKAETVIKITKSPQNRTISFVEPDMLRGEEFESFVFQIDDKGIPFILNKSQMINNDCDI
jgi:hypothetical protein